jgi:hypothetical protein
MVVRRSAKIAISIAVNAIAWDVPCLDFVPNRSDVERFDATGGNQQKQPARPAVPEIIEPFGW